MKKIIFALVAVMFLVTPAMAGNQPEYDAVGCDATNFFNDFIKVAVCENGTLFGDRLNEYSAFAQEFFQTTAGQLFPDYCFGALCQGEATYRSALTTPYNESIYRWQIVLQKKPESDIDLNIRDCVIKHNEFDIWTGAEQTGRFRWPYGDLSIWIENAQPLVTVWAYPGEYATPGFTNRFLMYARPVPGLNGRVPLNGVAYTSKALWEESIVMELPWLPGDTDAMGNPMYHLHQGDYLNIEIRIPFQNTVDLFYGPDNVVLKYIGIVGTEYFGNFCGDCQGCIDNAI